RKVPEDPRPVRVIQNSGRRYNPADLESILDTFGVPEIEVRSVDDSGRVEYGDLRVNPGVVLNGAARQKLDALLMNDGDLARTWNREKRMRNDSSWSGYALSIANRLALAEFTDQEIIDILSVHRREHGDPGKRAPKTLRWFTEFAIAP